MLLSYCRRFLPSVTIEEKVVTTSKEKGQLQRLKEDLGRKYDGLSLYEGLLASCSTKQTL